MAPSPSGLQLETVGEVTSELVLEPVVFRSTIRFERNNVSSKAVGQIRRDVVSAGSHLVQKAARAVQGCGKACNGGCGRRREVRGQVVTRINHRLAVDTILHREMETASSNVTGFNRPVASEDVLNTERPGFRI